MSLLGITFDLLVEFGILCTDVNKQGSVEVGWLVLFTNECEWQSLETIFELWGNHRRLIGEAVEDSGFVQPYPSSAYDENLFPLYI